MTSMQIAEVTGKQHCDVLRAIRNMEPAWEKITESKFTLRYKINELANGFKKKIPYYELTKTECLYIATKFNDEARARLILRWEQLETERLQQPQTVEVLPPPIKNQQVTSLLIEYVNGKPVTTSRKLAEVLGRKHDSVLETIKSNRYQRAFKYGNFTTRPYSTGAAHGYEFLITRKGLDALAAVMRYNAKSRIAEAYAGVWDGDKKLLPAPVPPALPLEPVAPEPGREDARDTIRELVGWIDELRSDLRKARATAQAYAQMYEDEKRRCELGGRASGLWHDLYEDLLWRMSDAAGKDVESLIEAHIKFKKRVTTQVG